MLRKSFVQAIARLQTRHDEGKDSPVVRCSEAILDCLRLVNKKYQTETANSGQGSPATASTTPATRLHKLHTNMILQRQPQQDQEKRQIATNSSDDCRRGHLPSGQNLHRGLSVRALAVPPVRAAAPRQALALPLVLRYADEPPSGAAVRDKRRKWW